MEHQRMTWIRMGRIQTGICVGLLSVGNLFPSPLPFLSQEVWADERPSEEAPKEVSTQQKDTEEKSEQPQAGFEEELTVTGTREERRAEEVPTAIGLVQEDDLQRGHGEGLDDYLNAIPGVYAASNDGGSDVKLSVRGFGARSAFGVRDLLLLVDGVSITDADGFTRLDQIDLASAERVEVVKGPASALYGNAAFGGVVNVLTEHGTIGSPSRRVRVEGGELGFSKVLGTLAGGFASQQLAYALHLSNMELRDFREHNDTLTRRLNGSLDSFLTESTTLRFQLNMSQMRNEIPGSLNREQFAEDPDQVRPIFVINDQRRDDDRYRVGGLLEHQLSSRSTVEGRLFYMTRDLDHPIFQVIDQQGRRFLGGARYLRDTEIGSIRHRWTLGVDGDREAIDNRRFANVLGQPGAPRLSADETISNYAVYLQDEMNLSSQWSLTLGARFDSIRFDSEDRLLSNGDQSDDRSFEKVSPKLGLLWSPKPELQAFVSLATAFQTPTKSELSGTVGPEGFNPNLDPQSARHIEVGIRGRLGQRLRFDTSLFHTEVEDEILPFTRINNRTIYGNVGETLHQGVEIGIDLLLPAQLELSAGYSWSDNELTEFGEFTGNVLPGHPEHRGSLRLSTRRPDGLNGSLSFVRTGTIFLNDANTETNDPFGLLNLDLRYDFSSWSVFLHASNLTDESYAAWLAVNDRFGNYFQPGKPRAVSVGFDVRF